MSGDTSLVTLYISITSACILWCIETELSLFISLQNNYFHLQEIGHIERY